MITPGGKKNLLKQLLHWCHRAPGILVYCVALVNQTPACCSTVGGQEHYREDLANIGTQITPPFPTMQFLKREERFSQSENNAPLEQGQPPPPCTQPRTHVFQPI